MSRKVPKDKVLTQRTVGIAQPMWREIRESAKLEGVTMSEYIRRVLAEHLGMAA